ncbi:recombination protein RecR [bacterium]|nr:recombination protein RecR [bacterium]
MPRAWLNWYARVARETLLAAREGRCGVYGEAVARLVAELRRLPGIGQRTAERLAFHLVVSPKPEALGLAEAIKDVKENVRPCSTCKNVTERDPCELCADESRDRALICVVERPMDVLAVEKLGIFRGLYHVLLGSISLLDGVDAKDLTIDRLVERIRKAKETAVPVREVILATNPNFDGDATALHLRASLDKLGVRVTRIARGLPSGSSLEVASKAILAEAIEGRRDF